MKTAKCWITGAGGLIGSYLAQTAKEFAPKMEIVALSRAQLNLTDFEAVRRRFCQDNPQLVIHCAALSKSPECEANPDLAHRVNVEVTAELCALAAEIPFVFFSSDLVFDGLQGNYDESAPVNPLNVYGRTKVAAEQVVLQNPRHTVIRTSLNGGVSPTGDRGFNEQMRLTWQAGRTLRLFTDEFRCPISAKVTARAVWELVRQEQPGLYHVAGGERLSRWQMGRLVAERWSELNPRIEPGSAKNFQAVPRAPDTSLNCAKVQRLLSFRLPGLTEWLREYPNESF